jgi:hypothetical protein
MIMNGEMMRIKKALVGTNFKVLFEQIRFKSSKMKNDSIDWARMCAVFCLSVVCYFV